jgi:hypothetical protein
MERGTNIKSMSDTKNSKGNGEPCNCNPTHMGRKYSLAIHNCELLYGIALPDHLTRLAEASLAITQLSSPHMHSRPVVITFSAVATEMGLAARTLDVFGVSAD